jgi:protein-S-isoprenylcysteine O-methyltransferase Ste14
MNTIVTILYFGVSLATFVPVVLFSARRPPRGVPNCRPSGTVSTIILYIAFFASWVWCGAVLIFGLADNQLYGVSVFGAGAFVRITALYSLRHAYRGRIVPPTHNTLVKTGIYAIVRHPLHLGLVMELTGTTIIAPSRLTLICLVTTLIVVLYRNWSEDKVLRNYLGREAAQYQSRVPSMNFAIGLLRRVRSVLTEAHKHSKKAASLHCSWRQVGEGRWRRLFFGS